MLTVSLGLLVRRVVPILGQAAEQANEHLVFDSVQELEKDCLVDSALEKHALELKHVHAGEIELEWLALLYLVLHPVRLQGDPESVYDLAVGWQ